ncbi:MAG: hypothetical protein GX946_00730 [Oligosphaeraceae bacterium]|nr:hypothetical protein [Oligosphaeraceae bacterium]
MTSQHTKETTRKAAEALQEAVRQEMEIKAKFGQQAVVCGRNGETKVVSAKYLLQKMKNQQGDQGRNTKKEER